MKEISFEEWYGLIERISKLEDKISDCFTSLIIICVILTLVIFAGIFSTFFLDR